MGKLVLTTETLTTASAGTLEYDGKVPYFTPQGLQRGVVPGMQYYRLNSALVGANATGAQSTFGVGVTLSSSTVYAFEIYYILSKSAGTTSHTISIGYGGTATLNNALIHSVFFGAAQAIPYTGVTGVASVTQVTNTVALTAATGAITAAVFSDTFSTKGTVSVGSGGTFIPQYQLSAAPGGAYSTLAGSYFLIYPIGTSGSNTSVGTWA
jgi:hypothetical protein